MVKKNAIFFDRDGVLIKAPVDNNNKPKSIKTYDQIEWIDDIENICSFYKKNYYLIMVTNQPDVTRKINSIKSNIRYLDGRLSDASHTMGHWSGRMEYEMLEGQIREANVELLDSLAQLRMLLRN